MFAKNPRSRIVHCLILGLVLVAMPFSAFSQSEDHVRVSLIPGVTQAQAGQSFDVLLRQEIDEGWHTYWMSPGDSGAPPTISWEVPDGVEVSDFRYPWPERIAYGPLMNFGYHDEVLMPFTVSVAESFTAESLRLKGTGRVLVCEEICIPQSVSLELSVPLGERRANPSADALFERAMSRLPVPLAIPGAVEHTATRIMLTLALPGSEASPGDSRLSGIEYFPFQQDVIDNPAEQGFELTAQGLVLALVPGYEFDPLTADLSGVLVLREDVGGGVTSAFEISAGPGAAEDAATGQVPRQQSIETAEMGLLMAVLFAFLGGLILNLMPCVFPVLSIKILSLVDSVHEQGESIRVHGLAYTAGVVGSFVAIAAVLIILRATGEVIGWGFQLQSPMVVSLLAYLFLLIGLNLMGVFEIGLSLMSLGGGASTQGASGKAKKKGYLGSVSTGVLATIVAAPCTAPFMGAAVGYALLQSPATGLVVFAALGAGMAVPYLLLCYSPTLLAKLPRPGNWMVALRQFLAFPMFASAVWLLWVLGVQAGPTAMMQVLGGGLLIAFAIWLFGSKPRSRSFGLILRIAGAAILGLAVYIAVAQESASPVNATQNSEVLSGETLVYSPQALVDAQAQGPVFVNFTAAWCITCKVNELNALNLASVRAAFRARNITYLRADWTNEDPQITAALQEFGRSGVPLYLLYPQGSDDPHVLPQLLTESVVMDALEALN